MFPRKVRGGLPHPSAASAKNSARGPTQLADQRRPRATRPAEGDRRRAHCLSEVNSHPTAEMPRSLAQIGGTLPTGDQSPRRGPSPRPPHNIRPVPVEEQRFPPRLAPSSRPLRQQDRRGAARRGECEPPVRYQLRRGVFIEELPQHVRNPPMRRYTHRETGDTMPPVPPRLPAASCHNGFDERSDRHAVRREVPRFWVECRATQHKPWGRAPSASHAR